MAILRISPVGTLLPLTPLLAVLLLLFGGGIALAIAQSLGMLSVAGDDGFTLAHYAALLDDREFHASLALSVWIASISTAISVALGLALAWALHHQATRSSSTWVRTLLQFPLAVPHLSLALVVLHLASPSGLVSRVGHSVGLVSEPADFPLLIQDGAGVGIVLAYVWKEAPFLAVVALTMLARVGREYEDAARTLGANSWLVWKRIHLPLIAPALVSASLAVFAYVFGAFEVPLLLGRTYPAMLGVLAERRFSSIDLLDRPAALAVALTMSMVAALLVWIYLRLARNLAGERPVLF